MLQFLHPFKKTGNVSLMKTGEPNLETIHSENTSRTKIIKTPSQNQSHSGNGDEFSPTTLYLKAQKQ